MADDKPTLDILLGTRASNTCLLSGNFDPPPIQFPIKTPPTLTGTNGRACARGFPSQCASS
jgi:hypothetical protein